VFSNALSYGLSVKPGTRPAIEIDGGVTTYGQRFAPFEMHGTVDVLRVNGAT